MLIFNRPGPINQRTPNLPKSPQTAASDGLFAAEPVYVNAFTRMFDLFPGQNPISLVFNFERRLSDGLVYSTRYPLHRDETGSRQWHTQQRSTPVGPIQSCPNNMIQRTPTRCPVQISVPYKLAECNEIRFTWCFRDLLQSLRNSRRLSGRSAHTPSTARNCPVSHKIISHRGRRSSANV